MVTQMMQMTMTPVAAIFCGHIGNMHEFDGAAIALSVSNMTHVYTRIHMYVLYTVGIPTLTS